MKRTWILMVALLAVVALAAGPALAQPKVLKISNGVNEQHPSYLAGKKFGEILAAKLPGKYEVQVYANAQLGDDVRATEGVRMGTLEMVTTSASPLTGLVPEFNVFDLPFIITSEKAADAIYDGPIGAKLAAALEPKGIKLLAYYENGFRQLTNSVREVKAPADMKGLKIRTMQNPIHLEAFRAMGANPTPMPFSEVFTALAAEDDRRPGKPHPDHLAVQVLRSPEVRFADRARLRPAHRADQQEALRLLPGRRPEDHCRSRAGIGHLPADDQPQDEQ